MAASGGILEFKDVSKFFGKVKALEEVSFSVKEGEFVFIVGPSGAGKTTILKLILGEHMPTAGKVIFDGDDVGGLERKVLPELRRKIGVVFQDYRLIPERTIAENVEVALAIAQVSQSEWESRVSHVLKLVGLTGKEEMFPAQLSGGELQRVSIARAVVTNPKLIFADEPTGNLDWETAGAIMELLAKINKEGKTVIVTSHNRAIVEKMGKRVIELKSGRVEK